MLTKVAVLFILATLAYRYVQPCTPFDGLTSRTQLVAVPGPDPQRSTPVRHDEYRVILETTTDNLPTYKCDSITQSKKVKKWLADVMHATNVQISDTEKVVASIDAINECEITAGLVYTGPLDDCKQWIKKAKTSYDREIGKYGKRTVVVEACGKPFVDDE